MFVTSAIPCMRAGMAIGYKSIRSLSGNVPLRTPYQGCVVENQIDDLFDRTSRVAGVMVACVSRLTHVCSCTGQSLWPGSHAHHMHYYGVGRSSMLTTMQMPAHAPAKQGRTKHIQPSSAFSCGSGTVFWSASGAAAPQRALLCFLTSCVKMTHRIRTRRAPLRHDAVSIPVRAAAKQTCCMFGVRGGLRAKSTLAAAAAADGWIQVSSFSVGNAVALKACWPARPAGGAGWCDAAAGWAHAHGSRQRHHGEAGLLT